MRISSYARSIQNVNRAHLSNAFATGVSTKRFVTFDLSLSILLKSLTNARTTRTHKKCKRTAHYIKILLVEPNRMRSILLAVYLRRKLDEYLRRWWTDNVQQILYCVQADLSIHRCNDRFDLIIAFQLSPIAANIEPIHLQVVRKLKVDSIYSWGVSSHSLSSNIAKSFDFIHLTFAIRRSIFRCKFLFIFSKLKWILIWRLRIFQLLGKR